MMLRTIRSMAVVLVLGLAPVGGPNLARGSVFFGDISGNNVYSSYFLGPGYGVNNAIAEGFTMTQTLNLTSVDLLLQNYTYNAGSNFGLSIYSSVGGRPGVDLYDLSSNVTGSSNSTPSLQTYSGTGSFTLTAGTTYFLDLYATNPAASSGSTMQWVTELDHNYNQVNPSGTGATDLGQTRSVGAGNPPTGFTNNTEQRTAFELNGAAVPEPGAFVLVGIVLGAACCGMYLRARRRPVAA